MQRVGTYGLNAPFPSADMNLIQDNATGLIQLNGLQISGQPYIKYEGALSIGAHDVILGGKLFNVATNTNVTPLPGGSPDIWLSIVEKNSGGSHAYEIGVTTPLDGNPVIDASHRYLGALHYGGSGNILYYRKVGKMLLYKDASQNLVVTTGVATSDTAINFYGYVPDHVRMVLLEATFSVGPTCTSQNTVNVGPDTRLWVPAGTVARLVHNQFWAPRSAAGTLTYKLATATDSFVNIRVAGYEDIA